MLAGGHTMETEKRDTILEEADDASLEARALAAERMGKKIIRQGNKLELDPDSDTLYVHWQITSFCNWRCSYCLAAKNDSRSKKIMPDMSQIETAIDNLAAANRTHYRVALLGGEPTTHPLLIKLILCLWARLGKRLELVRITTNGSFSDSQLDALRQIGRFMTICIDVSVHVEFASMERIKYLINRISAHTRLGFDVMLHPVYFDKVKGIVDELIKLRGDQPFSLRVSMIRRPPDFVYDDERYTREHYDYVKQTFERYNEAAKTGAKYGGAQIENDRLTKWRFYLEWNDGGKWKYSEDINHLQLEELTDSFRLKDMICFAGKNIVDILPNGLCRGVTCTQYRHFANIYQYDPYIMSKLAYGMKCNAERCGADPNHNAPKFLFEDEAEAFIEAKRKKQIELTEEWLRQQEKKRGEE